MSALFAATHPDRTAGLVLIGTFARLMWAPDYPLGSSVREQERRLAALEADDWLEQTASEWLARVAPGLDDEERLAWYRTYLMRGASPAGARALRLMNQEIDVRDVLPVIAAPTLVLFRGGEWYAEGSRYVGEHVPGARIVELPGNDHLPWEGDADELLDEIERFVEDRDGQPEQDRRVLATILSIRGTGPADPEAAGERVPAAELPGPLRSRLRAQLGRFRGREMDGGGVTTVAAFDGPARAIRCGIAIVEAARSLGIELRAGLHTGEVELDGSSVSGPAVAVAEGLAAGAEPGEVVVSQTVKDLVAGSGLRFAGPVPLTLPGDPGEWGTYTVEDTAVDAAGGTARAG
jgi:class 3 adenylate cyclase